MHHMTVYVEDVASAVAALEGQGFAVVDTDTVPESWNETFIRPASAFGALIQVAWAKNRWDPGFPGITLDDVLDGRVQVLKNVVTWKDSGIEVRPGPVATSR